MPHQDFDGLVVRVGVQIEIFTTAKSTVFLTISVSADFPEQMEFADAAVIAAFEFVLHEIEDDGVVEPAADVGADAVRPNEGNDLQALRFGIRQRMGAGIQDIQLIGPGHAVLYEQHKHLVQLIERFGFPVVVQMGIEYFDGLVGEERDCRLRATQHNSGQEWQMSPEQ